MSAPKNTWPWFIPTLLGVSLLCGGYLTLIYGIHGPRQRHTPDSAADNHLPRPPRTTGNEPFTSQSDRVPSDLTQLSPADLATLFRNAIGEDDKCTLLLIIGLLGDRSERDLALQLLADYRTAHPRPPYQPPGSENSDPFAPPSTDPAAEDEEPPVLTSGTDDPFAPLTLLHEFFSHYHPAAPQFLADLQRFTDPRDQYDALSGYAESSNNAGKGAAARALDLLQTSSRASAGAGLPLPTPLTPIQRNTLVSFIQDNLQADIAGVLPSEGATPPPDQVRAHLGESLQQLATIAPFLSPAEQSQLRGAIATPTSETLPYFAWQVSAPGADLTPYFVEQLLKGMIYTGEDQAAAALSTATAQQSEMIAAAYIHNEQFHDPYGPDGGKVPGQMDQQIYLDRSLANTTAIALFQAALNRNDPANAAQWLPRITDPAAHAAAAKKLQK